MNKAFRRSLLSLTAASAMTSSVFAGNAAYLDVKVNYLNPDNTVILGIDDDDVDNKQRDRVEILVSVLDKDGNYADKDKNGKTLADVKVQRNSTALKTDSGVTTQEAGGIVRISSSGAPSTSAENFKLYRAMEEKKNITRFVLDYSLFVASKLQDELVVKGGDLEKDLMINLSSTNAKGLIVRVTNNGDLKNKSTNTNVEGINTNDEDNYLNESFSDINVTDDLDLDTKSQNVPSLVAGDMVPLRVYASTQASKRTYAADGDKNATGGRFTLAPNLEGKTIVVQAVADYDLDGNASTLLNSVELTMSNGVAVGEIQIDRGLPGTNAAAGLDDGVQPHVSFVPASTTTNDGLAVAFIAYVKDDIGIANQDELDLANAKTFTTSGFAVDTDSLIMRSGDPVGLKVGGVDPSARKYAKLWRNTDTKLSLMDSNDSAYEANVSGRQDVNITLTVVDKLNNPALIASDAKAQYRRFDNDLDDNNGSRFNVVTSLNDTTGTALDFSGVGANNINTNIADKEIATITLLDVQSKEDKNGSGTETLKISYASGSLSGMDPVLIDLVNVEPVKSKISGNPILADILNVTAVTNTDSTTSPYGQITSGLEPLDGIGNENGAKNIYPEFKAKFKVTAIDTNTTDKVATMTIKITIPDPEKPSDFGTGDYFFTYSVEGNNSALGYKLSDVDNQSVFAGTGTTSVNGNLVRSNLDVSGDFFEFNVTSSTVVGNDSNVVLTFIRGSSTQTSLATVKLGEFTDAQIAKLKGNSVNVNFKAYDKARQEIYAEAYFETTEEPTGTKADDAMPSGSLLKVKFSGEVSEGDKVFLEFNGTRNKVLLEGETYDSSSESNSITTTLGADKEVSVVLYDTAGTSNKQTDSVGNKVVKYGLKDMTVNGLPVIYKTQKNNDDTDNTFEVGLKDLFNNNISVASLGAAGAAKVQFKFADSDNTEGGITFDGSSGDDGSEDEKQSSLSSDVQKEIRDLKKKTTAVTLDEEVKTDLFYGFFGSDKMAVILDAYDNYVDTEEETLEDNFVISCSSGMECSIKSESKKVNKDSYIKFKPEAAGTTQTITFKVKGNEEVSNTISFSNIRKATQNTKINITRDIGHSTFNVVNSEVVVKIVGDGGKLQEETKLIVKSANPEAKVRLVPLAVNSKFFRSIIGTNGDVETALDANGNYYFVSSDKPGLVTISAASTIKKDDSSTNEEVKLAGSAQVSFVAVDLDNPDVSKESITAIPSGLSIKINDANLDTDKTVIAIKGIDNDSKKAVEYKGNNTYRVEGLPKGTYQIVIKAYDLAGNYAEADYVRLITEGADAVGLEKAVANALDTKSYSIDGTFEAYDFKDGKAHLNWAYKNNATGKWYRLLGEPGADKNANPFGWSLVAINPNNPSAEKWYMIKLTGGPSDVDAAGKFGWAMVKSDLSVVKKIAAVKSNGSFEYLDIEITATMKDGKITFSAKK